jgi:RNA polymerase sigma factor for flagellar operon FliA
MTLAERDALITENIPLVRAIARNLIVRLPPSFELDDLVAAGNIGLIEAAQRFEVERGVPYSAYACRRIRGAMRDSIRRKEWLSATCAPLDEHPSYLPDYDRLIERTETAKVVIKCLDDLPDREKQLIESHYYKERYVRDAGREIGVGTDRATQLHKQALDRLEISLRRRGVQQATTACEFSK